MSGVTDEMVEAARLAQWRYVVSHTATGIGEVQSAALEAVYPLIRAQVLEEVAKVADDYDSYGCDPVHAPGRIAAAIRKMGE